VRRARRTITYTKEVSPKVPSGATLVPDRAFLGARDRCPGWDSNPHALSGNRV
jgi:hypothetical protein